MSSFTTGFVAPQPAQALSPTFGWLDTIVNVAPGRFYVAGWAATSDYPTTALGVRITIGGRVLDPDWDFAAQYRPDVGAAYPGYGDWHGYSFTIAAPPTGWQVVCAQAQNSGVYNDLSGCRWHDFGSAADPSTFFFASRFNRFRYSDATLRLGYSMRGSFTATEQGEINAAMTNWETGSVSRVDTFPEAFATSEVDFERVASWPGLDPGALAALVRVDFVNCGSWMLGTGQPSLRDISWVGCYSRYNQVKMQNGFSSLGPADRQETTEHEFGHAVGLGHFPNGNNTIMAANVFVGPGLKAIDQANLQDLYRWP